MLKNLGYAGVYHDERISVSVLLENPLDLRLQPAVLAFSVMLRTKNSIPGIPAIPEDFTFYVIDEAHRMYNTTSTPYFNVDTKNDPFDVEPTRRPDMIIHTEFRHEFMFQDLCIAFYYRPEQKINIIRLQH